MVPASDLWQALADIIYRLDGATGVDTVLDTLDAVCEVFPGYSAQHDYEGYAIRYLVDALRRPLAQTLEDSRNHGALLNNQDGAGFPHRGFP